MSTSQTSVHVVDPSDDSKVDTAWISPAHQLPTGRGDPVAVPCGEAEGSPVVPPPVQEASATVSSDAMSGLWANMSRKATRLGVSAKQARVSRPRPSNRGRTRMRRGGMILGIYLVVGLVVAIAQGYFNNVGGVGDVVEILVAILIWPLVLFGVDINIGGLEDGGGGGNGGGGGS